MSLRKALCFTIARGVGIVLRTAVIPAQACGSYGWTPCFAALAGGESARVGVATFDSSVHFYSLRASQAQPQMLVVPDVDAPYAPLPDSLVVPLQASRGLVDSLLHQIPRMFGETQVLDACTTAAIEAAVSALKVRGACAQSGRSR